MEITLNGQRAWAYSGGKAFDPALPCTVFIHGALHDHSVWTLHARDLAQRGHAVLALDLPGHGRSSGPALASLQAAGAWALAWLDALGVSATTWVGHSMGSLIALEAAAQAPERARALVLIGTAAPMPVAPALLQAARDTPDAAMHMVNTFSHSTHAAKPGNPGPGAWLHGANLQLMRRTQAGYPQGNLFVQDFELCNNYTGALAAAGKLHCPAHVVAGSRDAMTPAKAAKPLLDALKAKLHLLPAGHALMAEHPEGVRAALNAALADAAQHAAARAAS